MYGSPITKEIKKKHSSRLVGGAETGSQAERTHSKAAAGRPSEVADCEVWRAKLQLASKAAAGVPGDRPSNPDFQWGENKASNHRVKTPVGVEVAARETPSLTGEFVGETHRVLEHT